MKKDKGEKFVVERPEKYGGNLVFDTYEQIENAFKKKELHSLDLKNATSKEINKLLGVFRKQKTALTKMVKEAY